MSAGKAPQRDGGAHVLSKRVMAIVAGVVVAVAAVVGVVVAASGGSSGSRGSTRAASASASAATTGTAAPATTSAAPSTAPTGAWTVAPRTMTPSAQSVAGLPPALAAVPLTDAVSTDHGLVAQVSSIRAVTASGSGRGNVTGPALKVTVKLGNGTGKALSLDQVEVSLFYTDENTPASPVDDPANDPLSGTLDSGASARGTYVFTVPNDARDAVTVTVGYAAGEPLIVFSGPVD